VEELTRTPPLAYRVAEIIRSHVVERRLAAGAKLPSEREFAERLGVSRNVVREALRALELAGLIQKCQGKGAFVRAFDPTLLARQISFGIEPDQSARLQLLEARVALESAAMELVVRHATEEDLARLDAIVDAMEERERRGEGVPAEDLAFHQALLRATHNEPITRFSSVIQEWMEQDGANAPIGRQPARSPRKMSRLHRPIVDALRKGDVTRARRLIETHIEWSSLAPRPAGRITEEAGA
jgi:GntR family transcriptional repressor for pyruvate dehydrogenase complex